MSSAGNMSFIIERNSPFCSVAGIVSSMESISDRLAELRATSVGACAFIVVSSRVAASNFVATSICAGVCAVLLLIMRSVGSSVIARQIVIAQGGVGNRDDILQ